MRIGGALVILLALLLVVFDVAAFALLPPQTYCRRTAQSPTGYWATLPIGTEVGITYSSDPCRPCDIELHRYRRVVLGEAIRDVHVVQPCGTKLSPGSAV
jgi:hypothetical protein